MAQKTALRYRSKVRNVIVYGEKNEVLTPAYINCQRMEIIGKKHGYHVKPHLHSNLFQLHLVEKGKLSYTIDGRSFEISKPSVVIVPENILHELRQDKATAGMSISVSYSLLEQLLEHYPKGFEDFQCVEILGRELNESVFDTIISASHTLFLEHEQSNAGKEAMMRSMLGLLLIQILRLGESVYSQMKSKDALYFKYFNAFKASIKQECSVKKQIRDYAAELRITPTHLNRICQEVAGKTAKQIVLDHILLEAKKHLLYSSHSISEIGYMMQFDSPSYFTRYFKKFTNFTPKGFRSNINRIKSN